MVAPRLLTSPETASNSAPMNSNAAFDHVSAGGGVTWGSSLSFPKQPKLMQKHQSEYLKNTGAYSFTCTPTHLNMSRRPVCMGFSRHQQQSPSSRSAHQRNRRLLQVSMFASNSPAVRSRLRNRQDMRRCLYPTDTYHAATGNLLFFVSSF